MKIDNINCYRTYGYIYCVGDNTSVRFDFNEDKAQRFISLAHEIIAERKQSVADEVCAIAPVQLVDYTEVDDV